MHISPSPIQIPPSEAPKRHPSPIKTRESRIVMQTICHNQRGPKREDDLIEGQCKIRDP